jgi:hypothetical protein
MIDDITMKNIEKLCLPEIREYSPEQIISIRKRKENKYMKKKKRAIASRKKKKSRSKTSSHRTAKPEIKISAAILQLCEQLRKKHPEPRRVQSIIALTIIAWNNSLFSEEDRPGMRDELFATLPAELGEDKVLLLEIIDQLIAQKDKKFPHIREYIIKYNLDLSDGAFTLTVGTTPVPEKIQKRK